MVLISSDSSLGWSVDLDQQSPVYENIEEEPVLTSLVSTNIFLWIRNKKKCRKVYVTQSTEAFVLLNLWFDYYKYIATDEIGEMESCAFLMAIYNVVKWLFL